MSSAVTGAYFPQYPRHDNLPDPEIRTFITNFYHAGDQPQAIELWVSYFTKDAHIALGNEIGDGEQEIRDVHKTTWMNISSRKHTLTKVFPALFRDRENEDGKECELMLSGKVDTVLKNGNALTVSWAGHMVVKKVLDGEREEWRLAKYQVWHQ